MSFAPFERLLREAIGLDAQSIGTAAIEQAVRQRLDACGLDEVQRYWEHLSASDTERQALIEAVVVPETWFFRDREAFSALAVLVLEKLRQAPDATVRVLSVPCATGEEPYSMAMALFDAGVPASRFLIDAADVSERALARARNGSYGKGSFRTEDLGFRERYFDAGGGRYQVSASLRTAVRFHHRNLFAPDFPVGGARYDIIWCRNLLIYFDRPTQDSALGILVQLLTEDGALFVGPSETAVLAAHGLESTRLPLSFAFRRGRPAAPKPPDQKVRAAVAIRRATAIARAATVATATPALRPQTWSGANVSDSLDAARRLADRGEFAEAAARCQEHLRQQGPTAEALYLLGLVWDASGRTADAEQQYRKALYLDPNHPETLMHMVLLLDRQGRQPHADVLRRRIQRLGLKVDA